MESNKEALDLIQKCLDDRPYAAIRVIEIMARLERVKELLTEQEPNEPIRMHHTEHKQTDNYRCRECGNDLYFEQRFCDVCGKAVKWE